MPCIVQLERAALPASNSYWKTQATTCGLWMYKTCLHGAYISPYVHPGNRQILVRSKRYANCLRMVQHRFAVPSTHTHIWFTNRSQMVCEPFGMLVYTRINVSSVENVGARNVQEVCGTSAETYQVPFFHVSAPFFLPYHSTNGC